jgi:hypothetical protein
MASKLLPHPRDCMSEQAAAHLITICCEALVTDNAVRTVCDRTKNDVTYEHYFAKVASAAFGPLMPGRRLKSFGAGASGAGPATGGFT